MNAPDEKDLLRVLVHQLEMDLREDAEPQPPPVSREFVFKLAQSRLWPIRSDQPLAEVYQDPTERTGTVVHQDDRTEGDDDGRFSITIRPAADGDWIELKSPVWPDPDRWEPLAIVVGQFADGPALEPATNQNFVQRAPERHISPDDQAFPAVIAASMSAAGSLTVAADDEGQVLEGRDSAGSVQPVRFSSRDVKCLYHRWEALLEVEAQLPAGQDGGLAVGQLSYVGSDGHGVVQRRLLTLRVPVGEAWKGSARFHPPRETRDGVLDVLVRPFTVDDLDLLPADGVRELLAGAHFASMRLQRTEDGYRFRPLLPHQKKLLADPDARWCLRMARVAREEEDDV